MQGLANEDKSLQSYGRTRCVCVCVCVCVCAHARVYESVSFICAVLLLIIRTVDTPL